MPNDDAISKTPITISQIATTNVRISIDSKGDPSITMPANRLTKPKKICQARPGRCGSLIAEIDVATPRKMKPTPIQIASSKIA